MPNERIAGELCEPWLWLELPGAGVQVQDSLGNVLFELNESLPVEVARLVAEKVCSSVNIVHRLEFFASRRGEIGRDCAAAARREIQEALQKSFCSHEYRIVVDSLDVADAGRKILATLQKDFRCRGGAQ